MIEKVKNIGPWTYGILSMKESLERFAKKNCKKINQREFGVEKVIKGKGDTSYGNW